LGFCHDSALPKLRNGARETRDMPRKITDPNWIESLDEEETF